MAWALVAGALEGVLYWRLENTVVPFLPSDLSLAPLPDKSHPDDFHSSA